MKKHLSVLMLAARGTIYKILALILVMGVLEVALFSIALGGTVLSLEQVTAQSGVPLVLGVCFVLISALLCLNGCEFSSRQGYTLRRLSVSERSVFFWQSVYNTMCFLLLWGAQLGITLALCGLYMSRVDPPMSSGQTVFLAFYRSDFLHSLLPLEEWSLYARNIAFAIALGASSSALGIRQRYGHVRKDVSAVLLIALALIFFPSELGSGWSNMLLLCVALAVTYVTAIGAWRECKNEK